MGVGYNGKQMKKKVLEHFQRVDPILHVVALQVGEVTVEKSTDYFVDLCDAIVSQQLSGKAGATIFARFKKLFPKGNITPKNLLKIPDQKIRDAGMSWSKVKFVKSLANSVVNKEIDLAGLDALTNELAIAELVKLHGIGPWTAEMFLMFTLGREDIFSFGDLGLRRGIQKIYNMKKEPTVAQMQKLTKKWSPYRTWASRVLWKSLDG